MYSKFMAAIKRSKWFIIAVTYEEWLDARFMGNSSESAPYTEEEFEMAHQRLDEMHFFVSSHYTSDSYLSCIAPEELF